MFKIDSFQAALEVLYATIETYTTEDGQERIHAQIPNPEQLNIKKDLIEHASKEVQEIFEIFSVLPSEIAEILTSAAGNATIGTAIRTKLKRQGYSDRKIRKIFDELKEVLYENNRINFNY
jgi:hypothetical protein